MHRNSRFWQFSFSKKILVYFIDWVLLSGFLSLVYSQCPLFLCLHVILFFSLASILQWGVCQVHLHAFLT